MANRTRDPRTKEELLDRMLSFDFDGDIRHLGASDAQIKRAGPNKALLVFPESGRCYELSVRLPRGENVGRIEKERSRAQEERSFASAPPEPRPPEPEPEASKPRRGRPRRQPREDEWSVPPRERG